MWSFSQRILIQNRIINRNFLRRSDSFVGCFNFKPCFTRGKQDNSCNEQFKVSRLFEPNQPRKSNDGALLGAELTGKIDKSEVLKVLNKFSQKKENRILCEEYGLDGK